MDLRGATRSGWVRCGHRHGVHGQQVQHGIAILAAFDVGEQAFLKFGERSFRAARRLAAVQVHQRNHQRETDGGGERDEQHHARDGHAGGGKGQRVGDQHQRDGCAQRHTGGDRGAFGHRQPAHALLETLQILIQLVARVHAASLFISSRCGAEGRKNPFATTDSATATPNNNNKI